jgi:hypothetical protein
MSMKGNMRSSWREKTMETTHSIQNALIALDGRLSSKFIPLAEEQMSATPTTNEVNEQPPPNQSTAITEQRSPPTALSNPLVMRPFKKQRTKVPFEAPPLAITKKCRQRVQAGETTHQRTPELHTHLRRAST